MTASRISLKVWNTLRLHNVICSCHVIAVWYRVTFSITFPLSSATLFVYPGESSPSSRNALKSPRVRSSLLRCWRRGGGGSLVAKRSWWRLTSCGRPMRHATTPGSSGSRRCLRARTSFTSFWNCEFVSTEHCVTVAILYSSPSSSSNPGLCSALVIV